MSSRSVQAVTLAILNPKLAAIRPLLGRTIYAVNGAILIPALIAICPFSGRTVYAVELTLFIKPLCLFGGDLGDGYLLFHAVYYLDCD